MPKRKLDPYTMRAIAKQLDERADKLRDMHERKGWRQGHHFVHRSAELESFAMMLRGSASIVAETLECKPTKPKGGRS